MAGGAASGQLARSGVPERWPLRFGLGLGVAVSAALLLAGAAAPLQAGLVGDADDAVADVQAVATALHRPVLEGDARLLD